MEQAKTDHKLGELLFKYRDYTPIPFIILMVAFANADLLSLQVGGMMVLLGEIIRTKGVAYIGGVSRTRSYSLGTKVVTGGPFAHVRNPLYWGNFFLSTGLVVIANVAWLEPQFHGFNLAFIAAFIFFFFGQYHFIINWEEENLTKVFGEQFLNYKSKVGRWVPNLLPADFSVEGEEKEEQIEGDYKMAIKSEKNTLMIAITITLLILWRSGFFSTAAVAAGA
ncbi:MAG: methyltransferase [SAR324 cluster bacterium]|nr:methyltransferase [SAR324 cluster bacterium]